MNAASKFSSLFFGCLLQFLNQEFVWVFGLLFEQIT